MTLTLATRDDAVALVDLYAMAGLTEDTGAPDPAVAEARWDALHEALPGVRVVVGRRCDGTVMGALTLVLVPSMAGPTSAVLEDVAVHPAMQRAGLGRQLVFGALGLARESGCRHLSLSSGLQQTEAHAFCERLGFERDGTRFGMRLSDVPTAG